MQNFMRLGACVLALAFCGPIGCDAGGGGEDEEEEEGEEGPTMSPGEACLDCHFAGSGNEASEAAFTAAGTVFSDSAGSSGVDGATVTLLDADSFEVQLTTNSAGNFYTSEPLAFPIHVTITSGGDTVEMGSDPSDGNCNSCHTTSTPIHIP